MEEIRSESTWILYFLFFQSLLYNIASFSSARILTSLVTIVFIQEEDAFTIHIVKLVLETLLIISTKTFLGLLICSWFKSCTGTYIKTNTISFNISFYNGYLNKTNWNPRLWDERQNYSLLDETLGAWRVVIIWCTYHQNSQNAILKTFKFFKVMVI